MMKEWAAARQRVQEMKSTDSKAAEKLNKEITAVSLLTQEQFCLVYFHDQAILRFDLNNSTASVLITLPSEGEM